MMKRIITTTLLLFAVFQAWAEEQVLVIEGTRIRGNQELPTVLYVVPWQPVEIKQLETPKSSFTVQRPAKMLERNEFKRMLSYHKTFLGEPNNNSESN